MCVLITARAQRRLFLNTSTSPDHTAHTAWASLACMSCSVLASSQPCSGRRLCDSKLLINLWRFARAHSACLTYEAEIKVFESAKASLFMCENKRLCGICVVSAGLDCLCFLSYIDLAKMGLHVCRRALRACMRVRAFQHESSMRYCLPQGIIENRLQKTALAEPCFNANSIHAEACTD